MSLRRREEIDAHKRDLPMRPWLQGMDAGFSGRAEGENPHPPGTAAHGAWYEGREIGEWARQDTPIRGRRRRT